jgi:hypothetical protein
MRRGCTGGLRLHDRAAARHAICPRCVPAQCQQCRTIHNFHSFIHSPSSAETPFEPVNLWACWKFLWITWRPCRPTINRPTARRAKWVATLSFRLYTLAVRGPCRPFGRHRMVACGRVGQRVAGFAEWAAGLRCLNRVGADFPLATRGVMIGVTRAVCDRSHWGRAKRSCRSGGFDGVTSDGSGIRCTAV